MLCTYYRIKILRIKNQEELFKESKTFYYKVYDKVNNEYVISQSFSMVNRSMILKNGDQS